MNQDSALNAARKELTEEPDAEPTLRELLESLADAEWDNEVIRAELLDSLAGLCGEPPAVSAR
jgi:hypothetical protein